LRFRHISWELGKRTEAIVFRQQADLMTPDLTDF
jgi:hypothetical protein